MMKKLLLIVALLPAISWAAVTDLATLQQQLSQYPLVRGEFSQLRKIAMFKQPLQSSGQFTLHQEKGLLWQQQNPFAVDLVLTENKLRQSVEGQPAQVITAEQNQMAFYFSRIFLAVFRGDTAQLEQSFTLDLSTGQSQWHLTLTPKTAPLNQVFRTIQLSGEEEVDSLTLEELRGDITELSFSHQTHQPEQLSDAEQALFNF